MEKKSWGKWGGAETACDVEGASSNGPTGKVSERGAVRDWWRGGRDGGLCRADGSFQRRKEHSEKAGDSVPLRKEHLQVPERLWHGTLKKKLEETAPKDGTVSDRDGKWIVKGDFGVSRRIISKAKGDKKNWGK